ncbi:MAG: fumarylacetoacetate hydrolase family protein, partial [Rhodomicrobium sp.]|nr:fumarylacetoacetate hydrolase family protein [Rhodomicrobium sp.]
MTDMTTRAEYIVALPAIPALPVLGDSKLFPIHRIYCVGRNYADHAIEMGGDPARESPVFFMKSADCIVPPGGDFPYPAASKDVHHEIELVIALGSGGSNVPVETALDLVAGYAAGFDMTARDLQAEAKKGGRPWEVGKSFEASAPCSAIALASKIGHPSTARIWLELNGAVKQDGNIDQLIWKVPEMIAYLSRFFTLQPGDL